MPRRFDSLQAFTSYEGARVQAGTTIAVIREQGRNRYSLRLGSLESPFMAPYELACLRDMLDMILQTYNDQSD